MKLAIFGATGGTGQQLVEQALAAGHRVVALVRDPAKVTTKHPDLTLLQGNVLELADVVKTINGVDGVLCSLGNTANNPAMVVSTGTQNIVQAMRQKGIKRLIVISSLGVGDSKNQVGWLFKLIMWTFLRKVIRDKEEQEKIVQASGLEWTIIRPGGLADGPRTGHYKASLDPSFMASRVVRADVAEFALKELTDPIYLRKTPAITS
ncbi:MAG: SDR family oxidoreductase [Chloroflexi bacterium]|nr:SDR family oxidoreductase [Chloroflexota bacterium]